MSEKINAKTHEQHDESRENTEITHDNLKQNIDASPNEHNHNIDKIQASIHEIAQSKEELNVERQSENNNQSESVLGMHREMKSQAYDQTIRKIHHRLSPVERTFSKLIHNKLAEPISDVSSNTIARPSGLVGGGIVALLGSIIVLYVARRYGFEYNLSIFFVLLGVGFVVGLVAELGFRVLRRKNS